MNNSDISVIKDTSHVSIGPFVVSAAVLSVNQLVIAFFNTLLFSGLNASQEYGHSEFVLNELWILILFFIDKLSIPFGRGPNIFVMLVTWETSQLLISWLKELSTKENNSVILVTPEISQFSILTSYEDGLLIHLVIWSCILNLVIVCCKCR